MEEYLVYAAIRFTARVVRRLPVSAALWIGRLIGRLAFHVKADRRRIAYANLKFAFGAVKPPEELMKITKSVFENMGQSLMEVMRFPDIDREYVEKYLHISGLENIENALKKGNGAILLTAHFGNWELSAAAACQLGYRMNVLAREQKHTRLNGLLNSYRESRGATVITKGMAVREIYRKLKNNELVGILADQYAGSQGVFVDFLGRPASTPGGAVAFASRTGCAVIPSFIVREEGPYHRIHIEKPLELEGREDDADYMEKNLSKFVKRLEEYVGRYPEQWLWLHKRWKKTPLRKIVILSDRRRGHLRQSEAVAKAVERYVTDAIPGAAVEVETLEVTFRSRLRKALFKAAVLMHLGYGQGRTGLLRFCLAYNSYRKIIHTLANLVVSCGSSLAPLNIVLARECGAKKIVLMKPDVLGISRFDLCVIPEHDNPPLDENIVVTEGAPNPVGIRGAGPESGLDPEAAGTNNVRMLLLMGGNARRMFISDKTAETVVDQVLDAASKLDSSVLAVTSSRTPGSVESIMQKKMCVHPWCRFFSFGERNSDNLVEGLLGLSDIVVVSGESISMVSEAATSGKCVLAFKCDKRSNSRLKHEKALEKYEERGHLVVSGPDELSAKILSAWKGRKRMEPMNDLSRVEQFLRQKQFKLD